jgi:hypothetical protein
LLTYLFREDNSQVNSKQDEDLKDRLIASFAADATSSAVEIVFSFDTTGKL